MKTNFWKTLVCACAALGAAACSDIDDLRRDVDDLEHRVTALETQIRQLNDNVAALQTLMNGTTVNNVTEADGIYTVTLSNGEVLTLTQGSEGGYIEPKVAIDEEGYWIISVNNDGQFERMKDSEGHDVRAVAQNGQPGNDGSDGATPQFRVDGENYWQVSYDGGTTWEYVLNGNGQKVKADTAAGTTDPFFADVKVEGDKLVLTLLDGGTPYEIPIYAGFKCIISGASSVVDFDYNATKTFDVDMEGVETTIVTAPAGWTAELAAKAGGGTPAYTLTVTAPASDAAKTRAAADSRTDVSILAVASNGLSTIAKLRVNTTGTVLHKPSVTSVTVDAAATTENSLTFSVATDDADGWKYICQPSADTAPDAAKVMADGTAGTTGANTVSGLTKNTAYTIYVVAYNGDTSSALETAEARTLKGVTDYWEEGVTLGGVKYDKNTAGAKHITTADEAANITASGIYFIEPGLEITFSSSQKITELVLIGSRSDQPAKVTLGANAYFSLSNGTGLILKNIELVASERANYIMNSNADAIQAQNLILEDCTILAYGQGKHFSAFDKANATIKNIEIKNTKIRFNTADDTSTAIRIINFTKGSTDKVTFNNNIIYTKDYITPCCLFFANNIDLPTATIDVQNCSIINSNGTNAYLQLGAIKSINFSKNILWCKEIAKASYTLRFSNATPVTAASDLVYEDNLAYGLAANNSNSYLYFSTACSYKPNGNAHAKSASDPFASMDFDTGKFVPAVAGYGATIE